jgi:hypothetical protein
MITRSQPAKTLIFCTAYVPSRNDPYYAWDVRYRIWLEATKRSGLKYDQILIVDDGSDDLPNWDDIRVLHDDNIRCDQPAVLYHFRQHLGRRAISDFPGWVRSFFFVSDYAEAIGFTRIVHIEADAFLITQKACDRINALQDGWTALWCNRFHRPESGIQVIAGSSLQTYKKLARKPVDDFASCVIEKTLPFTHIERTLIGDRYGEYEDNQVPKMADWCMQARPTRLTTYARYFWWMPWFDATFPTLKTERVEVERGEATAEPQKVEFSKTGLAHKGLHYLQWLKEASSILSPENYFEIGTHAGDSLKMILCDAVCVDSRFVITSNVLLRRKNTHFFQGTSDEFFADQSRAKRLFPAGIDLAFLDGLHLYEALLADFINTERLATPRSVILLHDCLPLNERMAERKRRPGGDDEPQNIRDYWTGDVWKVIPILKKYRPEISLSYLDCGPTGLVVCTQLDSKNTSLQDHYSDIVTEFAQQSLSSFSLRRVWELCPMFSSKHIVSSKEVLIKALFAGREPSM